MSFIEYLKNCFEANKIVEKYNIKDQNFACNAQKTWNSRHSGLIFQQRSYLKYNQILFVEFGFGYSPELSYSHPCLLLSYDNRLCKVVPITSSPTVVHNAYHPVINPSGNRAYYLLPNGTCNLTKESALYIKQTRTISDSRIIKIIDANGLPQDMYSDIRKLVFKDIFEDISYSYHKLQEENEKLSEENSLLKKEIEILKTDSSTN